MTHIAVFCGSKVGNQAAYLDAARETGRLLARQGIGIVYGGGRVGLMGAMADAALAEGGEVYGVMPKSLVDSEIAHTGLTHLHVVHTMHERKAKMAELANGFVALPGGSGTLEEIFEQWTWAQLGIHQKPCGFLNINGYYDPVHEMAQRMVAEGFMLQSYADMLVFTNSLETILSRFRQYTPPPRKWQAPAAPIKP
ncbi:TIGR00730 family Rossman fold protein [Pusillimonas sp. TS35]|nr:TIGR00730 family Rossman fold protein [Pusillimonas sp. TS35]